MMHVRGIPLISTPDSVCMGASGCEGLLVSSPTALHCEPLQMRGRGASDSLSQPQGVQWLQGVLGQRGTGEPVLMAVSSFWQY